MTRPVETAPSRGRLLPAVLLALAAPASGGVRAPGNILLVIADDLGVDRVAAYGEHPDPGNTPNIDRLAERGVLFRNAWSTPLCSPTRATILTGRYGFRTGMGTAILEPSRWSGLAETETTLPELLSEGPYRSEALGKWHVATSVQGDSHPLDVGFCHHAGSFGNIDSYTSWTKLVDGIPEPCETYATTDTIDDAIELVADLPEPWFLWLAFNAPHGPIHAAPPELHSFELSGSPWRSRVDHVKAAVEAMDTELGRLLEAVGPETTVIFVGDNGTFGLAASPPFRGSRAKGTVYEGGLRVPLIVAGPAVAQPGSECAALVGTTDLFATIAELAERGAAAIGHPAPDPPAVYPVDSVSLVPYLEDPARPSLRKTVYAEKFVPNGPGPYRLHDRAIRGPRYKLIRRRGAPDELYDIVADRHERTNLLLGEPGPDERRAYGELSAAMSALLASEK